MFVIQLVFNTDSCCLKKVSFRRFIFLFKFIYFLSSDVGGMIFIWLERQLINV